MSKNATDVAKRVIVLVMYLGCVVAFAAATYDFLSLPESEVHVKADFYLLGLSCFGIFATRFIEMQWIEEIRGRGWRIAHWAFLFAALLCAGGFMSSCSPRQRVTAVPDAVKDSVKVASDSIHFTSGEEWMYGRVLDDSFNEYGYWVVLDEGADTLRIDIDLYCKLFNAERGSEDKFEVCGHVVGDSLVYTLSPALSYECEGGRGKYHTLARIDKFAQFCAD